MHTPTQFPDSLGAATLQRTLHTTVHTGSPALKRAVGAYVDEAKSLGWPIERIIVEMKRLARNPAGVGDLALTPDTSDRSDTSHVVDQAISWAIALYYGERAR